MPSVDTSAGASSYSALMEKDEAGTYDRLRASRKELLSQKSKGTTVEFLS